MFDYLFLGTGATPKYWIAEIKIGSEWVPMTTGTSEASTGTDANGQISNVILKTPDRTHSHYDCTYSVTSEIPAGELLLRLRVLDATIRISGSSVASPSSTATVRFVGWNSGHETLKEGHGPTVYVK